MEDTHFCYHELDVLGSGTRVFMFGVFDGHGGPGAATHCSNVLPLEVAAAMRESENVAHALVTAFERCEASWSAWANPSADDSGCTAQVGFRVVAFCPLSLLNSFVTVFVTPCVRQVAVIIDWHDRPMKLYVANAGDCRSVLYRRGQAIQISQDHTANVPSEASRIVGAGGTVKPARDGSLRVGGVIEVTRSIGDRLLKNFGLTSVPETHEVELSEDDEFFVMASDGVWGWIDNDTACDKVATTVKHVDFGPKRLISEAYEAGSDDNISVVVVYLRPPPALGPQN